ncbi:BLOC-3 complex member HPS1 isoform X2 [Hydra vulgaris]|uniref:BLOC-3 complex member HPS1 isoform X2 n=1 Tax=Hydra vulgaris TaxID=6087 RepID=A0ABM4BJ59_HYDVU
MKSLAVFSGFPDLLYLWTDEGFREHLYNTFLKSKLDEVYDINSFAQQLYSPLVTSNNYMKQFDSGYRRITCENGLLFVMKQVTGLFIIAICGDGEESELLLQRKISTFTYLLNAFYGPCISEQLKPSNADMMEKTWKFWDGILKTWKILCQQEHTFLVESVEMLNVNQYIRKSSSDLLSEVCLRANHDGNVTHLFLFVNNKLLSTYSGKSEKELHASDILTLILYAKYYFRYRDDTLLYSIYRTPTQLIENYVSQVEDKELFQTINKLNDINFITNLDKDELCFFPVSNDGKQSEDSSLAQQLLFLQTDCHYSPYSAHYILLDKKIVLVIVSKSLFFELAPLVQSLLEKLYVILENKDIDVSSRCLSFEESKKYVVKISNFLSKYVQHQPKSLKNSLRKFVIKWKHLEEVFNEYLNNTKGDLTTKMETATKEFVKSAKILFWYLFIQNDTQGKLSRTEDQGFVINAIKDIATEHLKTYFAYLSSKSTRNVIMETYQNEFPGLVHFIYTNRVANCFIAPTINIKTDPILNQLRRYIIIKQRIWDFWQYAETMLTKGYSSIMINDGDFSYSYFIWFEDFDGKCLYSENSLRDINIDQPTGVLSGSFYRNMIQHLFPSKCSENVYCYELVCMYLAGVSNDFISNSCKELVKTLRKTDKPSN